MIHTVKKIGNPNGVLIPKAILASCGITDEVDVEVLGDFILLRSTKNKPRQGWDEAFKHAIANGDEPEGDIFEEIEPIDVITSKLLDEAENEWIL
ncbi:hypothetical protein EMA8858_00073 [Emticicia aquatica]|jgi:antitoxin MazE|uniref:SpoVT-AbrB domain-containing protein n=1 Tax=Emticicia aquatica TaxID=1681835 RepID=A0ABM9AJS6_9BACT|nr:hypothetical protein [Emticicia aquatica]CAH0993968.1 hypothetical protein EMA8858_00073 [Emticicia aquatica]